MSKPGRLFLFTPFLVLRWCSLPRLVSVFSLLIAITAGAALAETTVTIRAKGDTGTETFSISHLANGMDGSVLVYPLAGESANVTSEFVEYTIELPQVIADGDALQIGFSNDGNDINGADRNLTIDWIDVDGRRYESEDPSVYSIGSWNFDDCGAGFKQKETLHCTDGYFEFYILDNRPPTITSVQDLVIRTGDTLRLRIAATDADGTVPALNLDETHNASPRPTLPDNGDGTRSLVWSPSIVGVQEFSVIATDAVDNEIRTRQTITVNVIPPTDARPAGTPLKDLAEQLNISIGYASILNQDTLPDADLYADFAREQFNIVTPENAHKWQFIHPSRNEYDFSEADRIADFAACRFNGITLLPAECEPMVLHGHPLVWHEQLPGWVWALPVASLEEKEEVRTVMIEHIDSLASRYADQIAIWDVVNEAVEANGSFRSSIWYRAMGENYIPLAFQAARDATGAQATLIYNDFDIAWKNDKSDAVYNMLANWKNQGVPIDGIGFQMHLNTAFDQFDGENGVVANFTRFAELGLDIYITELDVTMEDYSEAELGLQAEIYRKVLTACLEQPTCKAVQSWGFTDRYSWLDSDTPLPIDAGYQAKPAFTELQATLQEFIDLRNVDSDSDSDSEGEGDGTGDGTPGGGTTPSAPVCVAGKFNELKFEYDADNDTGHSLRNQFVRIGPAIDYQDAGSNTADILVQDASNKKRPQILNTFVETKTGDMFVVNPNKNGATTLRFTVTVGIQQQTVDMKLTCSEQNQLQIDDEFGPITFLGAVE